MLSFTQQPPLAYSFANQLISDMFPSSLCLGLVKAAIGGAAGGIAGLILFRTNPSRAASVAAGVGVAVGSTYERMQQGVSKES